MKLKRIFWALLVAFLFLDFTSSETYYKVSETELLAIQTELTIALDSLNKSRSELATAQTELLTLREQLTTLSAELKKSETKTKYKIILYTTGAVIAGAGVGYLTGRLSR